jgi:hypothetical protein
MTTPLLRFEDSKVAIGGKNLFADSAGLSLAPALEVERVYGDYDANLAGAKTQFVNFSPTNGLKGKLDVSFFISAEQFAHGGNPNTIHRMFEIAEGMSEVPIHQNRVGRYAFDNMYLTSFTFDMSPFQIIKASASYDIYGSVNKVIDTRFSKSQIDFAHSLKSFGGLSATGITDEEFEISSLNYNIIVGRKVYNHIRGNEGTIVNTSPNGVVPVRVSVENIEKEMTIGCSEMLENLNAYGDKQDSMTSSGLPDSKIEAFLLSMQGDRIARFSASGKIQSESMSIAEGKHADGKITIKEIVK